MVEEIIQSMSIVLHGSILVSTAVGCVHEITCCISSRYTKIKVLLKKG